MTFFMNLKINKILEYLICKSTKSISFNFFLNYLCSPFIIVIVNLHLEKFNEYYFYENILIYILENESILISLYLSYFVKNNNVSGFSISHFTYFLCIIVVLFISYPAIILVISIMTSDIR